MWSICLDATNTVGTIEIMEITTKQIRGKAYCWLVRLYGHGQQLRREFTKVISVDGKYYLVHAAKGTPLQTPHCVIQPEVFWQNYLSIHRNIENCDQVIERMFKIYSQSECCEVNFLNQVVPDPIEQTTELDEKTKSFLDFGNTHDLIFVDDTDWCGQFFLKEVRRADIPRGHLRYINWDSLYANIQTVFNIKVELAAKKLFNKMEDERKSKIKVEQSQRGPVQRPTYVYIMKDDHNGLYKIGKSVNPKYRERTLQSEKPSIKMVFFTEERDDFSEYSLHSEFAEFRIRGEWFDLTPCQVRYICHLGNS